MKHSVAVNAESVIVEGDLVDAIFVVDKLHFVNHVFGASHTVSTTKHANSAAEITPKHASSAADQWDEQFAVMLEVIKRHEMMSGEGYAIKVFDVGAIRITVNLVAVTISDTQDTIEFGAILEFLGEFDKG